MYDNEKFLGNSDYSKDIEFHLHSYTHPQTLEDEGPHILSKGDGIYVYDETGKKFIEGMSGLWCTSLGFSEKELVCLLYTSPSPRDYAASRMPSSA